MNSVIIGSTILIVREGDPVLVESAEGRWVLTQALKIQEYNLRKDGPACEITLRVEVTRGRKPLLGIPFLPFGEISYTVNVLNMDELEKLREEHGWVDIGSNTTFGIMIPDAVNSAVSEILTGVGELD